jgi:hypothetical protein
VQIREGWVLGLGSLFGAAAAVIGLLMLIHVAPVQPETVGTGLVLAGLARVVP